MPQEIENADGTKVTVYTADEVEAAKASAVAPIQEQLTANETALATAKADLAKVGDKDHNFGELRKKVETLEAEKQGLTQKIETGITDAVLNVRVNDTIEKLSDGDSNTKEKTALYYKQLSTATPPKSEAEAAKLVRDAYVLATKNEAKAPDTLNSIISSGGAAPLSGSQPSAAGAPLTDLQKAVAANLGISEEDAKKYPAGSIPTQSSKKS